MRISKTFLALPFFALSSLAYAAPANTLINCIAIPPMKLSPAIMNDDNDFNASSQQVYNRLVEFKAGKMEVEPALAEAWEVSADGLTYTSTYAKV